MTIHIDSLRKYLVDYYGSAIFSGMPLAFLNMVKVQSASPEQLIQIARQEHIDLSRFVK